MSRMGAAIEVKVVGERFGEPVGDVRVRGSELTGTTIEGPEVPTLIDELPLVAVLASFAEGEHGHSERRRAALEGVGSNRGHERGAERARGRTAGRCRMGCGLYGPSANCTAPRWTHAGTIGRQCRSPWPDCARRNR